MQKPFKTYRQQLGILRSRNLTIANGSRAIKILKKEGYYNIINGYKHIFLDDALSQQNREDYYKTGVTFENIYALYEFDRNMRNILIKYLLATEASLKTKVAYHFSEQYKQTFNYLDYNNFDSSNPKKVTELISRISIVITEHSQKQSQGGQFYHYLNKYKELPMWVLVKKMTFGEVNHFFDALQPNLKTVIADEFIDEYKKEHKNFAFAVPTPLSIDVCIYSMLTFLNAFRNICAHDERLYNAIIKKNNKIPKVTLFHKTPQLSFKSRLFDCILVLGFFISKKEYKILVKQVTAEVDKLSHSLPQSLFNSVLIAMGFAKTWQSDLHL